LLIAHSFAPSHRPPFIRRIAFTLDVHNEAVKAMKYPPDAYRKVQSADKDKDKKDAEPTDDELAEMLEDDE